MELAVLDKDANRAVVDCASWSRRKNVEPRTQLQISDLMFDPATHEVKRAGSITTWAGILLHICTKIQEVLYGPERREVFSSTVKRKIDLQLFLIHRQKLILSPWVELLKIMRKIYGSTRNQPL